MTDPEITSPEQGHYLASGVERAIFDRGRSAVEIAAAVRGAGGLGFAAHPLTLGGRMLLAPPARRMVPARGWPALDNDSGCDGIELWSLTTEAAEAWRTPTEAWRWCATQEAQWRTGRLPRVADLIVFRDGAPCTRRTLRRATSTSSEASSAWSHGSTGGSG